MAGEFTSPEVFSGGTTNLPTFQPVQSVGPRIGVQAPMQQAPTPISKDNAAQQAAMNQRTLDAITKMGSGLVEAQVKQEQQELFLQGAQRQMSGEALTDIVDSQPWYSKIFGPSATAQGARKMAELTSIDTVVNGMAADMGTLRQLSPEDFQAELRNRTQKSLTGDTEADTTIQMQILESSQALVKAHTKEHYAYTQEQMQEQYTSGALVNADQLQMGAQQYAKGMLSKDEFEALQWKTSASLVPMEGQNQESYFAAVHAAGVEAMQKGNWHYVKMMEQSGVVSAMPSKLRQQWREEKRTEEQHSLSDLALGDYHLKLANITAASQAGRISPKETLAAIAQMNKEVAETTGIERPFLGGKEVESIVQGNLTGIYRAQERAEDKAEAAAAKRQEQLEKQRLVMLSMAAGTSGNMIAAGVVAGTDVQATANTLISSSIQNGDDNWKSWAVNNFNQGGLKFNAVATLMQNGLRASVNEEYNPAMQQAFRVYTALNETPGGAAAASAYAGESAGQLQTMYEAVKAGQPEEIAYQTSFRLPAVANSTPTEKKAVIAALSDKFEPTYGFGWLSDKEYWSDQQKAVVSNLAIPSMKRFASTSLTVNEQLDRALPEVMAKVDLLGEQAVLRSPDQPTLASTLKVTQKEASSVYQDVLNKNLKAAGLSKPESINVQQIRLNGENAYYVDAYEDGQFKYMVLHEDDFREALDSRIKGQQRAQAEETKSHMQSRTMQY